MIKNYLTIAFRIFSRNKYIFLLNVTGLVLGISCFASLAIFIHHELSYDKFYKDSENIYRITTFKVREGRELKWAITNGGLVSMLREKVPGVKAATKLQTVQVTHTFTVEGKSFTIPEQTGFYTDGNILDIFNFKILAGDSSMLIKPKAIVLIENFAKKLFGSTDVLGKTIVLEREKEDDILEVTGVLDNLKPNSHIQFDYLISGLTRSTWKDLDDKVNGGWPVHVYFKVFPGINEADLALKVAEQVKIDYKDNVQYPIQKLTDIYFNADNLFEHTKKGNINFVKILSIVAIFTIAISIINYVLLSTSQSFQRAREIGIRKVLGSSKRKLFTQFLAEAVVMGCIAGFISAFIIELILGIAFPLWFDIQLSLWTNPVNLVLLLLLSIAIGVFAGLFPALKISSFNTIQTLKGKVQQRSRGVSIRMILVTSQFVFAIAILVGSIVVLRQLHYMKNMDLGFERDLVINIPFPYSATSNAWNNFKQSIRNEHIVKNCGTTYAKFIGDYGPTIVRVLHTTGDTTGIPVQWNAIDYNAIPTLGIKVVEGRNFSPDFSTDSVGIIFNMTAKKQLGIDNILGLDVLNFYTLKRGPAKVVGIIEDYQFQSFNQEVVPVALFFDFRQWESNLLVKIASADYKNALETLEKHWNKSGIEGPFQYSFVDEWFANLIKRETQLSHMVSLFTLVSMVITMLGLLGLVSYVIERRKKEIGVRKVLGASVKNILVMVNKGYIGYILLAFIIAIPLSLYGIEQWLQSFAYHISITPLDYIITALIVLTVAILTISLQSLSAAVRNPVDTLKEE